MITQIKFQSKTLNIPCRKIDLMKFLNIKSYPTFNKYMSSLNLPVKGGGRTTLLPEEIFAVLNIFGIKPE